MIVSFWSKKGLFSGAFAVSFRECSLTWGFGGEANGLVEGFCLWSVAMIIISMHDWLATRPLGIPYEQRRMGCKKW